MKKLILTVILINAYVLSFAKFTLFTIIALLLMMCVIGCEKDSTCYQGKIISLNNGACYDIIKIEKSISQGLPVNSTISFDPNLYDGQLEVGDIVYFKIIVYEEWTGGIVIAMCTSPQYAGQIEFCRK